MSAPTNWLILRGLAREQRNWATFPAALAARHAGARVHTLDLPGAGTEHRRASPLSVKGIAEDLRARWLALRDAHDGPWHLLGVSLGGMVTMQWSADHPADFAAVVIVNSSAGNLSAPWRRFDPRIVPGAARAFATRDPVERQKHILGITTRVRADVDAIAREFSGYEAERPMARAAVLRQIIAGSRFRAPARLGPPALVVSAAADALTHPGCAVALARHFGVEHRVHPAAGHDLPLDDPEWLADAVAAWCEARSARA